MVLHRDDATSGDSGVIDDGFVIQGFDGEWVDDADVYSFWRAERREAVPEFLTDGAFLIC